MTIPLDPRFIPAFSIEDVLLDKDTGAPLSGGQVYFEIDDQRGMLKPVYQITGASPNYTFIQLPNPMTLSSIGTFEDALGNPVIPYFYPYKANGDVELYYVRVTSSDDVPQFVREAVPYIAASSSSDIQSVITNEIANPQFSEVLFDTSSVYTYDVNGVTNDVIPLAPDWDLVVTSPGLGSITVTQFDPPGSLNVISNPATILTISSSGLTSLVLRQRKYGSPNLWGGGYVSASYVARTHSGTAVSLNMYYSQSDGTVIDVLLVEGTLPSSGAYVNQTGSALIPVSTSTQTFPNSYIDIFLDLPVTIEIDITSIMVAFTGQTNIQSITSDQESLPRQIDHLFHYYKPELEFMPIPSYLIGWDFPLNPAQFGEAVAPNAVGANKSYYVWDQTIVFQSVNSSLTISREAVIGNFTIQAAATGRHAIIQYLGGKEADDVFAALVLNGVSANVVMESTVVQDMNIAMYWTASASLPTMSTGTSLVTGFDVNGYPTVSAGWIEIARTGFDKSDFTTGGGLSLESHDFSNFADLNAYNTAKFFAIVVSTKSTLALGNTVEYKSISLVPGKVPTIPAPQTSDEVLRECSAYYTKSYETTTTVGTAATLPGAFNFVLPSIGSGAVTSSCYPGAFTLRFPVPMFKTPTVTLYSPVSGTASTVYIEMVTAAAAPHTDSQAITPWTQTGLSTKGVSYVPAVTGIAALLSGAVSASAARLSCHYQADARLGF
jgi:hypothetical protein